MIVGFSGKMGTGKTTLAGLILNRLHGLHFPAEIVSFGSLVKTEAAGKYGFPVEWAYSPEGKSRTVALLGLPALLIPPDVRAESRLSVRRALQYYATEVVRQQDPDYWVHKAAEHIASRKAAGARLFLVDDVRFPNELAFILRHGVCYRLYPYDGWEPGAESAHVSETALDSVIFDEGFEPPYGTLPSLAERIFQRIRNLYNI